MTVKKCIKKWYKSKKEFKRILKELEDLGFDIDEDYDEFDQNLLLNYIIKHIRNK